ncbi:MAG: ribosomal subunit interface protein [Gammaproteobacteria bacterium]|nr:MAG: ribosomal subunit interface protein [Gammaproteobacteria bacterium]
MNLTISGHHMDVTPAIRQHVEEKLVPIERSWRSHHPHEVTLVVEKHLHKAEANLHVAGADLFASPESDDMYAAIDSLADKLIGRSSSTRKTSGPLIDV